MLGGIGSWAASMLIKSGVSKIRIIDFDQISLSGLNQLATATRADLGTPKAIAMKKYFRTIAPWAEVDARVERFQADSAEELLSGKVSPRIIPFFFFFFRRIDMIFCLLGLIMNRQS